MKKILASFMLCLLLTACSSNEPEYVKPIASYENPDIKNFNVSMDFFKDNTATITLHQLPDSTVPVERGEVIPFRIEGTDVSGEAQHDILKTIKDKWRYSAEMVDKVNNQEPITVIFKINEDTEEIVELGYGRPRGPSD